MRVIQLGAMESLTKHWSNLSLYDREGGGVHLVKEKRLSECIIAAKFLTKRALNIEAIIRTFNPLWRSKNGFCCADSTPGLKSITINKRKLNNKHTQRTQEFTWFSKLPTSTETTEKFYYKNWRDTIVHKNTLKKPKFQYTLTLSHPQDKKTLFFFLCGCCSLG